MSFNPWIGLQRISIQIYYNNGSGGVVHKLCGWISSSPLAWFTWVWLSPALMSKSVGHNSMSQSLGIRSCGFLCLHSLLPMGLRFSRGPLFITITALSTLHILYDLFDVLKYRSSFAILSPFRCTFNLKFVIFNSWPLFLISLAYGI